MTLARIGTFWSGPPLSWLEQLCLSSFVGHGHEVTLYGYEPVGDLPDGVRFEDAAGIMPADSILVHERTGSPAYHSDIFRLRMIRETGKVWADTDAYCLRPWHVPDHGHFHGWVPGKRPVVANGVLGLPSESETLSRLLSFLEQEYPIPPWFPPEKRATLEEARDAGDGLHISRMPWGTIGPDALTHFLIETGEIERSMQSHVLYPVSFRTTRFLVQSVHKARALRSLTDETVSIHFYGRRIRNLLAETGGVPPEGGLLSDLLAQHGIDPKPTAHVMGGAPPEQAPAIDFSALGDEDVANLLLQRSEAGDVDPQIRAWQSGDSEPLLEYAREHRADVLARAFAIVEASTQTVIDELKAGAPKVVAEIGPGYGFAALLMYRALGCGVILVDTEQTEERHFGFTASGSAYSNLARTRQFLESNGMPPELIVTVNHEAGELGEVPPPDVVVSMKACGFHFPVGEYAALMTRTLEEGGRLILDIRKGSGGIPALRKMGAVRIIAQDQKLTTVVVAREMADAAAD